MASQLRAALFDLDDTLIDWSGVEMGWRELEAPRLIRVHAYVCAEHNSRVAAAASLIDLYQERTMEAWAQARESLIAPHMPNILFAVMRELGIDCDRLDRDAVMRVYDWNVVPGTAVFPDVFPMLEALRAAGIKLGIVTNASQPMALRDAELAGHGLIAHFPDCRLSAADSGYLKPHPRIFQAALARLGTAPTQTVFIGDNPSADIAGALAAGMRAVQRLIPRRFDGGLRAVKRDAQPGRNDQENSAKASLHSLDELPAILDRWYPGWRDGVA